jgi:hypothetical protein
VSAGSCCLLDVAGLRDMLRDEFGARGQRDRAVAEAVASWYTRQNPELLLLIDQPNLAGIIANIGAPAPAAGTEQNAARYLALRNVPDDQLGAAGVPCVAMPDGPDHGNYVNGDDADRFIDEALEYPNAPPIMRGHQWTPAQIAAMTDSTKGPRPPLEFNTIKKGGAQ